MLLWFLKIISSGLYLHKSFGTASQKLRLIDTFERDCRCEWSSWILAPDGFYPQQSIWQMEGNIQKTEQDVLLLIVFITSFDNWDHSILTPVVTLDRIHNYSFNFLRKHTQFQYTFLPFCPDKYSFSFDYELNVYSWNFTPSFRIPSEWVNKWICKLDSWPCVQCVFNKR